jgi:alkylhydroperoxidase/carboxymuconolactone decarboxylase family protein YurZ
MDNELLERGRARKREVLGDDSDKGVERDRFTALIERFDAEFVWGLIWSRPGLSTRIRCLLNIGMLVALNRQRYLASHIATALKNGCSQEEIVEVILQANAVCGGPAANEAFQVAHEIFAAA